MSATGLRLYLTHFQLVRTKIDCNHDAVSIRLKQRVINEFLISKKHNLTGVTGSGFEVFRSRIKKAHFATAGHTSTFQTTKVPYKKFKKGISAPGVAPYDFHLSRSSKKRL